VKLLNTELEIGAITKFNHWVMAFLIFMLVVLGSYMVSLDYSPQKLKLYDLHKSFGTLILIWVLVRVILNSFYKLPHKKQSYKKWELFLAKFVQLSLLALMVFLPLSGWIMSSSGGFSYKFFGIPMPDLVSKNSDIFEFSKEAHELFVFLLLGLVFLHICGAIKHHVVEKDKTLLGMLPRSYPYITFFIIISLYAAGSFLFFGSELKQEADQIQHLTTTNSEESETETSREIKTDVALQKDVRLWQVQQDKSKISFNIDVSGEKVTGMFSSFSSTIYFDEHDLENSYAKIIIDLESVDTGRADRDSMVLDHAWFNTKQFPFAEFVTHKIIKHETNSYLAESTLEIKGVKVPVNLVFTLDTSINSEKGERQTIMRGHTVLNRIDFNIGSNEWSDPGLVAHSIEVDVDLVAFSQD
jgi:cytochrome b561